MAADPGARIMDSPFPKTQAIPTRLWLGLRRRFSPSRYFRRDDGLFEVGDDLLAHRLVLACGVSDALPDVGGMDTHYGASVFHCTVENRPDGRGGWWTAQPCRVGRYTSSWV